VDPRGQRITVLKLERKRYTVRGDYAPGERAASLLLKGFEADVREVFDAGKGKSRARK